MVSIVGSLVEVSLRVVTAELVLVKEFEGTEGFGIFHNLLRFEHLQDEGCSREGRKSDMELGLLRVGVVDGACDGARYGNNVKPDVYEVE